MPEKKIVIVGGGPAGLCAATELVKLRGTGTGITMIEQDDKYLGGISKTVCRDGFRFDIGGHRFFSKNEEINRWWQERLPNDFLTVKRKSSIFYKRKFFDYPLKASNALVNLGLLTSARCILSYLLGRCFPIRNEVSFADWVTNRFGKRLYNIFFKSYTEKVWGIPCEKISADWAVQRIKNLSLLSAAINTIRPNRNSKEIKTLIGEFQYPRLGPGMMWDKTGDDLIRKGVSIRKGEKVIRIFHRDDKIISVLTQNSKGIEKNYTADEFILSMPLKETLLSMEPAIEDSVKMVANCLSYRDFIMVALVVKNGNIFNDNWIYIHEPYVKVGRIQNFNNWSREMLPKESGDAITCLGMEYFCNEDDKLWNLSDDRLISLAKKELIQLNLSSENDIERGYVYRMPKAYPVYGKDYQKNVNIIKDFLDRFENLHPCGRNGLHKYNNQDHSMMTGILAARNIYTHRERIWNVNEDAEYYESGK